MRKGMTKLCIIEDNSHGVGSDPLGNNAGSQAPPFDFEEILLCNLLRVQPH